MLVVATAVADCEARDVGVLEQDVNAWTSLGYVGIGLVIGISVVRGRLPRPFAAFAAMVALEGVGSYLYHAQISDAAQFLHDVPLIGALGFIAGWHTGRLAGGAGRMALVGLGVATLVAGVLWALSPGATNIAVGLLLAIIVGSMSLGRLHRHQQGLAAVWNTPMLLLTALAVPAWLAGTPGSPICDEQSLVQPHGLWHLLTALLALAWADRAAAAR